ncbi:MAG: M14 family zinc carboxypeptidase [Anaerolineaceae bacterium]
MKRYLMLILLVMSLSLSSSITTGVATPSKEPVSEIEEIPNVTEFGEIKVVRVYYDSAEDIKQLYSFDLFEYNNLEEKYVLVAANANEIRQIQALGFKVVVDEEETTNYHKMDILEEYPIGTIPPPYNCYRTVEEIYAYAAAVASTYPNLAEWIDVGNSWEKSVGQPDGYDMMVLKLTNKTITGDKPKLFITASIHAREYTPAELAARFAEYLIQNYNTNADVNWLLNYHEIHIMFLANPDGRKEAEGGELWRKNTNENYCGVTSSDRGADLNRNFAFQWACCGGSTAYPCGETYHGPSAASEPETQAIQNYMLQIFPDQRDDNLNDPAPEDATGVYLDLHSYGELVLWPWGFSDNIPPNGTDLQTLGRKYAYFNNYTPQQSIDLYVTDGGTEDYSYGKLGVAGYCFEVGEAFFEACDNFENYILPDNLPALIYAAKTSRTPYMTPAGPDALNLTLSQNTVPVGTIATLNGTINDTRYKSGTGEPTQAIAEAEYALDIPYWEDGYVPVAMTPADGNFNANIENVTATVDTAGWSQGRHILYVRGKDANNNWGAVTAIFLTITGPYNEAPIADDLSISTLMDTPISFTLTGSDPEGAPITFTISTNPAHGTLSGTAPALTYTPNPGFIGTDSFTFTVSDGGQDSEPGVVSITVNGLFYLPWIQGNE